MPTKQTNNEKDSRLGMAGLAGAVIGAGVAVVATKALSDEKNRQKISEVLETAKKKVLETTANLADQADTVKSKAQDMAETVADGKVGRDDGVKRTAKKVTGK